MVYIVDPDEIYGIYPGSIFITYIDTLHILSDSMVYIIGPDEINEYTQAVSSSTVIGHAARRLRNFCKSCSCCKAAMNKY
jgi:hypothetical protein